MDVPVRLRERDGVATIMLCRPEVRNAVDPLMAAGIEAALDVVERTAGIRVAVLAAEGPVFCAGADLRVLAEGKGISLHTERGGFAGLVERERSKPLIAAVDGLAVGGGFELVLACDMVVASTSAGFGLPEVQRSLLAAGGGLFRLHHVLPRNVAMQLALSGAPLAADRAHELGLVNVLTPPGGALDGALTLAAEIAGNGPLAVQASRAVLLATANVEVREAFQRSRDAQRALAGSEDQREGIQAFLDRRPPVWRGV